MKNTQKKKPVAPILRTMEVGQIEEWNSKRIITIDDAIQKVQRSTDKKFQRRVNFTTIQVKRTK